MYLASWWHEGEPGQGLEAMPTIGDKSLVTLGLPERLDSPRVMLSTEPYPGRWTTHIPLLEPGDVDRELLGWIRGAYEFSSAKR